MKMFISLQICWECELSLGGLLRAAAVTGQQPHKGSSKHATMPTLLLAQKACFYESATIYYFIVLSLKE